MISFPLDYHISQLSALPAAALLCSISQPSSRRGSLNLRLEDPPLLLSTSLASVSLTNSQHFQQFKKRSLICTCPTVRDLLCCICLPCSMNCSHSGPFSLPVSVLRLRLLFIKHCLPDIRMAPSLFSHGFSSVICKYRSLLSTADATTLLTPAGQFPVLG